MGFRFFRITISLCLWFIPPQTQAATVLCEFPPLSPILLCETHFRLILVRRCSRYPMNEATIQNSLAAHAARNVTLLEKIAERGADLYCDRTIDCFFFAPTEDAAISLSSALQPLTVRDIVFSRSDDDSEFEFTVQGSITSSVTAFTTAERTEQLVRLAAKHRCTFDGWGTSLANPTHSSNPQ